MPVESNDEWMDEIVCLLMGGKVLVYSDTWAGMYFFWERSKKQHDDPYQILEPGVKDLFNEKFNIEIDDIDHEKLMAVKIERDDEGEWGYNFIDWKDDIEKKSEMIANDLLFIMMRLIQSKTCHGCKKKIDDPVKLLRSKEDRIVFHVYCEPCYETAHDTRLKEGILGSPAGKEYEVCHECGGLINREDAKKGIEIDKETIAWICIQCSGKLVKPDLEKLLDEMTDDAVYLVSEAPVITLLLAMEVNIIKEVYDATDIRLFSAREFAESGVTYVTDPAIAMVYYSTIDHEDEIVSESYTEALVQGIKNLDDQTLAWFELVNFVKIHPETKDYHTYTHCIGKLPDPRIERA